MGQSLGDSVLSKECPKTIAGIILLESLTLYLRERPLVGRGAGMECLRVFCQELFVTALYSMEVSTSGVS